MASNQDLRTRLRAGETVIGASITVPSPELVEVVGHLGYDFVTIDMEHECIDDSDAVGLIRAAEAVGITPIARVAFDPHRILRLLDSGVAGIHIPRCNDPEAVESLLRTCLLHPEGKRTFYNLSRSGQFSVGVDDEEWAREANARLLLVITVEEEPALQNLDQIFSFPRLDLVYIGKKDLWQSLGMPTPEAVEVATDSIAESARAHGKPIGLTVRLNGPWDAAIKNVTRRHPGMITVPLFDLIISSGREALSTLARGSEV